MKVVRGGRSGRRMVRIVRAAGMGRERAVAVMCS